MHNKLSNNRPYKMLTVVDEYTHQARAVHVAHKMSAANVSEALYPLFITYGRTHYIRSDNGPEFTAKVFQKWLTKIGIKPIRISPGSPW